MQRSVTVLFAFLLTLVNAARAQSPPNPATSPPAVAASAQQPAAVPPPKTQPMAQPPAPTGRYVWVPDAPQPPITPIQPPVIVAAPQPTYAGYMPPQPVYGLQYAVAAPIQPTAWIGATRPPTTIQFGGGIGSSLVTGLGQALVHIGSKRHTWTIQHTVLTPAQPIGMAAPVYTTQFTVATPMPQPVIQAQYYVPQPVAAPPPAANPPSEAAPPPPPAPQASPQSQRRIGLLDGLLGPH
jgi:hypothetical protein